MKVVRLENRRGWAVVDDVGRIISEHDSNARAWRAADRLEGEPTSKREDTADWLFRKQEVPVRRDARPGSGATGPRGAA